MAPGLRRRGALQMLPIRERMKSKCQWNSRNSQWNSRNSRNSRNSINVHRGGWSAAAARSVARRVKCRVSRSVCRAACVKQYIQAVYITQSHNIHT